MILFSCMATEIFGREYAIMPKGFAIRLSLTVDINFSALG